MNAVARVMDDFVPAILEENPAGLSEDTLDVNGGDVCERIAHALRQRISEDRFDLWFGNRTRMVLAGRPSVARP